ncbi:MAG: hypothetical protein R6V04_08245 [bacterium]
MSNYKRIYIPGGTVVTYKRLPFLTLIRLTWGSLPPGRNKKGALPLGKIEHSNKT